MNSINALQLGERDWNKLFNVPDDVVLNFTKKLTDAPKKPYDIVFLEKNPSPEELEILKKCTKTYSLFALGGLKMSEDTYDFFQSKMGKIIPIGSMANFLKNEARYFFPWSYGEKFTLNQIEISPGFQGKVSWTGGHDVTLKGDFGDKLSQILCWRYNIPINKGQAIDLWLEYEKESSVQIALVVSQYVKGSIDDCVKKWILDEKQLQNIYTLDNKIADSTFFVSIYAKGYGSLSVIALHDRYSRGSHGAFIPGGDRYVTSKREEVFCYFDPGDRKPPLNIYFSGYKTKEGFEGQNMMMRMGAPFLLVSEARLEGGAFYMGNPEYEKMITDAIRGYMAQLDFTADQVVMSGISMGTYGALYYGCDIMPHALILGKPLASLGDIAENERISRPGGFGTSIDVLLTQTNDTSKTGIEKLNGRFWDKFDQADFGKTKFIIAYMYEDDYDMTAYQTLISHLSSDGVKVYGKGIHGRHNDDTSGIVGWFVGQYHDVLINDFGRENIW